VLSVRQSAAGGEKSNDLLVEWLWMFLNPERHGIDRGRRDVDRSARA
jgi:hypothetical protein